MYTDDSELTDAIVIYMQGMSQQEKDEIVFDHLKEYIDENLNEQELYKFAKYGEF